MYGTPARLLAVLGLLALPTSLGAVALLGLYTVLSGGDVHGANLRMLGTLAEAGIAVFYGALLYGIGWRLGSPPAR